MSVGEKGDQLHDCCVQGAVHEGDVRRECTASIALSMLLLLKQHLKAAYSMPPERIASFNPGGLQMPHRCCLSCAEQLRKHVTPCLLRERL